MPKDVITTRAKDYNQWYLDIVREADLAEPAPRRGGTGVSRRARAARRRPRPRRWGPSTPRPGCRGRAAAWRRRRPAELPRARGVPGKTLEAVQVDLIAGHGVRLTHVFETHIHNDYVTGGLALAKATGAAYVVNGADEVSFDRTPITDGETVETGRMRITALATPGHTFTHLSYLLAERTVPDAPARRAEGA